MPKSGLSIRRIAVTMRQDRTFAGNVEVTVDRPKDGRLHRTGPWPLSETTAVGLGVATRRTEKLLGFGKDGTVTCRCKGDAPPLKCTRAERQGRPCETVTFVLRKDEAVRLHRCKICHGFFIAHYSARICSDACTKANHQAWVEAHRRTVAASEVQRRTALAATRCQVCGAPFKALRLSARFCSNRCRQSHHRAGRKAADHIFDRRT
jgi:hypothetical protein